MKASVSTYCHCGDDDRPHCPAEWEHGEKEKKERVGRPWCSIVNFETLLSCSVGGGSILCACIVSPARLSLKVVFTPSLCYCHLCRYQWQAELSQVKLCFVCGGIQIPSDPVAEVKFCYQSLFSDRKWVIYTCITTKWQDTVYCMCVLVSVPRSKG